MKRILALTAILVVFPVVAAEVPAPKKSPKEALQALHDLIGSWRGTGEPQQGTRGETEGLLDRDDRLGLAVQGR